MKNQESAASKALRAMLFDSCLLLTGTPLQNNMTELWTLMSLVDPAVFSDLEGFLEKFEGMGVDAVKELHSLLRPYLLRREKEDVETSLPPREETLITVEMTPLQRQVYRALYDKNYRCGCSERASCCAWCGRVVGGVAHVVVPCVVGLACLCVLTARCPPPPASFARSYLSRGAGSARSVPSLMNLFMELRKCCNHPYLIKGVEDRVESGQDGVPLAPDVVKAASEQQVRDLRWEANLTFASGKMLLLSKLLPRLKAQGSKVLVFSQMVRMLDLLQAFMDEHGYQCERIDGTVHGRQRQQAIDRCAFVCRVWCVSVCGVCARCVLCVLSGTCASACLCTFPRGAPPMLTPASRPLPTLSAQVLGPQVQRLRVHAVHAGRRRGH